MRNQSYDDELAALTRENPQVQLVQQAVLGKHLLRVPVRQQLLDQFLPDCHTDLLPIRLGRVAELVEIGVAASPTG